jgi:1,2-phenylacetyl-CoA epoxidase catalytic subunit
LTESGWVVNMPEVKQIIQFLGMTPDEIEMTLQLREYFEVFLGQLGMEANIHLLLRYIKDNN